MTALRRTRSDVDFGGTSKIRGVLAGTSDTDGVSIGQFFAGSPVKAVRVVVDVPVDLTSPGATLDSVTMVDGDDFLVTGNVEQATNGIYTWKGAAVLAPRALSANTTKKIGGCLVIVTAGTQAGSMFRLQEAAPVLGQDPLSFTQWLGADGGVAPLDSPTFIGTPTAPTAAIETNTVQLATTEFVQNHVALLAPKASPVFTGVPAAPTAAVDTNTTQLASTAFVLGQASTANPVMSGTAAAGSSTRFSRADHVHPSDTSRAALSGANFTGNITAPNLFKGNENYESGAGFNLNTLTSPGFHTKLVRYDCVNAPVATVDNLWYITTMVYSSGNYTQMAYPHAGNTTMSLWIRGCVAGVWGTWIEIAAGGDATRAPLASPAFTGVPTAPTAAGGTNTTQIATTAFVQGEFSGKAPLVSPTFSGTPAGPTAADGTNTTQLATTAFVQTAVATRAALASPTFTGTPAAPTAAADTNTTQIATTAFVVGQAGTATPAEASGSGSVGTSTKFARQDHVHPNDSTKANLSGAAFTGAVTAPNMFSVITAAEASGAGFNLNSLTSPGFHSKLVRSDNTNAPVATASHYWYIMNLAYTGGLLTQMAYPHAGNTDRSLWLRTYDGATWSTPWDQIVVGSDSAKAPLASPAFTGVPTAPTAAADTNTTQLATTAYVQGELTDRAPLASPTFTGTPAAPTAAANTNTTQLATTAFVVGQAGTALPLSSGSAATGVSLLYSREDHVHPSDTSRAPLASPTFTGTPAGPTAAVNTNTTQLATTAFVLAQAGVTTPAINGTAAVGTSTKFARDDHVHPTDTTRAALASPAFTGTPTAPTAASGTNTTQLATTAFVVANTPAKAGAHNGLSSTTGLARIVLPGGATYAGAASATGAFKIALPSGAYAYNTMLRMRVEIFDYALDESLTLLIAGYITTAQAWSVQTVTILANKTDRDYSVRFGNDGTSGCIWIGELASTWGHPRVQVAEVQVSYNSDGTPVSRWETGWAITLVTAFDTVEDTISGNLPVASALVVSPALTGTPTAPTAAAGTNTTQLATTAFVQTAVGAYSPDTASTTVSGVVELATNAECRTGTDTTRAVTPDGLTYAFENYSLAASGYQVFPGGLCIQWGYKSSSGAASTTLTFPIAFPTACKSVILGAQNADVYVSSAPTTTTVDVARASGGFTFYWVAFGY